MDMLKYENPTNPTFVLQGFWIYEKWKLKPECHCLESAL